MACKLPSSDSSIPYFAFSSSSFSFSSFSFSFSPILSTHNPIFFRISVIISFLFSNLFFTISRSLGSCPFASLTMSVCFFSVNFSRIATINIIFSNSSFASSICVVFLACRVSNSVVIASFNFFIASFNSSVWSELW